MELKNQWYYHLACSVVIMFAAAILFLLIVKWFDLKEVSINTEMVSFIGILATFIVVNNYAQMKDIENRIDRQQTQIKQQFKYLERTAKILFDTKDSLIELSKRIYKYPNHKYTAYAPSLGEIKDCTITYDSNFHLTVTDSNGKTLSNVMLIDGNFYNSPRIREYLMYLDNLDKLRGYNNNEF